MSYILTICTKFSKQVQTESFNIVEFIEFYQIIIFQIKDDIIKNKNYGKEFEDFIKDFHNELYFPEGDLIFSSSMETELYQIIEELSMGIYDNLQKRLELNSIMMNFKIFNIETLRDLKEGEISAFGRQEIEIIIDHFGYEKINDNQQKYNPIIDPEQTRVEWQMMKRYIINKNLSELNQNDFWIKIYNCFKEKFKNISCVALIALIIPVSSAQCERAFSSMKFIKNI